MTKTRAIRQARTFFGTRRGWRKFPRPRRLLSIVPTDQTLDWTYDSVGNRLTQNLDKVNDSIFDELTSYVYDVNDRLLSEITGEKSTVYGYDHTQQTSKTVTENGVITNDTSFEYNALGQMAIVTITKYTDGIASSIERTTYGYGSDGIRVSALHEIDSDADGLYDTATLTEYLDDPNNHTGYSQVLKTTEYSIDGETRTITKEIYYSIGLDQIAQSVTAYIDGIAQETETHYFTYDGHGSTRALLDATAAILQLYSFDAYGNALGFNTAEALTEYLYSGEQFDSKIGQQYLRARYYNPATGRFNSLDSFFGNIDDPQSLHKYLYTHAYPINGIDPSGRFASLICSISVMAIRGGITSMAVGAIIRVPLAIYQITNGVDLSQALKEMAWGLATDAAIGALLGGGMYGAVRVLGSNTFKLRALGQSITSFKASRIPGSTGLLNASKRGLKIEQTIFGRSASFLGKQIKNFPTIDDYVKIGGKGVATSVKSLDHLADSYQTASQVTSKLRSSARALQQFTSAARQGVVIGKAANPVHEKVLVYAFEMGASSAEQAKAITTFLREAPSLYPEIKVVMQFIP